MGQKEIKCPKCKESIMVDDSKEVCFCINCGEKIDLKKISLKKAPLDSDMYKDEHSINLSKLAKIEYDACNWYKAYEYYCQIFNSNPDNYEALFFKAISEIMSSDLYNLNSEICLNYIKQSWNLFGKTNPNSEKIFRQKRIMATEIYNSGIEKFNFSKNNFSKNETSQDKINLYLNDCEKCRQIFSYNVKFLQDYRMEEDKNLKKVYLDSIRNLNICIAELCKEYSCIVGFDYEKNKNVMSTCGIEDEFRQTLLESYEENVIVMNKYEPDYVPPEIHSTSKNNEGCYIATAVYGSYDASEVLALRDFRDNTLAKHLLGRIFIKVYYTLSPPVANWLKDAKKVNLLVKNILDKFVHRLSNK